jgi:DNA-binding LytR/AlgR family response regulator
MSIAMLAFIILADLKWHDVNPIVGDVFQLGLLIYFITILFSFIHLYFTHLNQKTQLTELQIQQNKNKLQAITIRSNRKSVNILVKDIHYIESLSDYVKIYTEQNTILTKEKISHLEKTLPEHFVRIHRSFLINNYNVEGFGHDYVHVHDQKLPIGRKYKKSALSQIGQA